MYHSTDLVFFIILFMILLRGLLNVVYEIEKLAQPHIDIYLGVAVQESGQFPNE